jgi:hypothetical protein
LIELRNKADAELRHTEKGLSAAGGQLDAVQRQRIEVAVAAVRAARDGDSAEALRVALDGLASATQPLAERLMNAVVAATLKDRAPDEVKPELVD